uniref:Uncharacterized protein n=1 Tax=Romanomermis culicivorax TaxID=13658 RepID=A0A915KZJ7_ROMCU
MLAVKDLCLLRDAYMSMADKMRVQLHSNGYAEQNVPLKLRQLSSSVCPPGAASTLGAIKRL